jgi:glycosyltransferase involved in cell wall biosynthesis
LERLLEDLELADSGAVLVRPYVDESELWSLAAACDAGVNLRWPTMGETSGIALRLLSLGKPLVVSDTGWFAELPDDVAVKVPVDEWEVDHLAAVLARLAADGPLRSAMAAAASAYVEREHSLSRVAERYLVALEEAAGGAAVRMEVLFELAQAAHDVGLRVTDPELDVIAARLRGVLLGG